MKLCIDCKHCRKVDGDTDDDQAWFCAHPELVSPVHGEAEQECTELRSKANSNPCGYKGKLWEAAE